MQHISFECSGLTNQLKEIEMVLMESMPTAMCIYFKEQNAVTKIDFILSGLWGNYVPEWNSVYENIVSYM